MNQSVIAALPSAPSRTRGQLVSAMVGLWFLLLAALFAPQVAALATQVAAMDGLATARLFSKICVVLFLLLMAWLTVVRSQPVAQAAGWRPRLAAVLGTNLVFFGMTFLTPREDLGISLHLVSAGLIMLGNAFALAILLRLGRSFSIMAEARRLVTTGPYAIVRHPLYLAEQIAIIGIFMQYASLPAAALVLAQLAFQIQRMRHEEAVLGRAFPGYGAYMARTARLVPGIW